ncbi:MAG: hypothetical protein ACXAEB_00240, partial [Candidatus Thorarchaeota archaeon]
MTSPDEGSGNPLEELFGDFGELELENVTIEVDELKIALRPVLQQVAQFAAQAQAQAVLGTPQSLISSKYKVPRAEYSSAIHEITIGATKKEGGSRSNSFTIGGHTAPAWNLFQAPPKNPP